MSNAPTLNLHILTRLKFWQVSSLSILLGALSALSMAPFHLFPVLFITFPGFIVIFERTLKAKNTDKSPHYAKFKYAAWLGWCFGFGYFLAGLWWIGAALLVDAEAFAWALPFVVLGLPSVLALFWALAGIISALFWQGYVQKILAISFSFAFTEFLRGSIFTGFPWNALGYAAMPTAHFMQSASLIGLWGVGLLMLFVVSTPALFLLNPPKSGKKPRFGVKSFVSSIAIMICALHLGFGVLRLSKTENSENTPLHAHLRLRIVQPNISQKEKWQPENRIKIFEKLLQLSGRSGLENIDLVIWPESVFPFAVLKTRTALNAISTLLPKGTFLAAGAITTTPVEDSEISQAAPKWNFYNTAIFFDDEANVQHIYRKRRLVPFGEFIPLKSLLNQLGIISIVKLPGGFAAGTENNVADLKSTNIPPLTVLICYEAIFPASFETHNTTSDTRAKWLLNITNDAWFGKLIGPYQHFHQARLRAVEQGLPMVRVANTGISAVIDGFGRIQHQTALEATEVIDASLPAALPQTVFAKLNNLPFMIMMALIGIVLIYKTRFNHHRL